MDHPHRHLGIAGARLGATAGPLSLLLLPKCPLCLVPLLGFLGVAVPASTGLWILAGVLAAAWLLVLLFLARRQPLILAGASVAAAIGLTGVVVHNRPLLWGGIVAMTFAGHLLSRMCAHRPQGSETA